MNPAAPVTRIRMQCPPISSSSFSLYWHNVIDCGTVTSKMQRAQGIELNLPSALFAFSAVRKTGCQPRMLLCFRERLSPTLIFGDQSVTDVEDPPGVCGDIRLVGHEDDCQALLAVEALE